jgi:predicted nucleotidyltransferase
MAESPDLKELLRAFNEKEIEYLLVGGHAVMKYTEPRFTKDLDVWIRNSPENAAKVYEALAEFGAPLEKDGLVPADFAATDMTYQIGVAPVRIDILTHITGVRFDEAWPNREGSIFLGVPVHFISLRDLIVNKTAVGRSSDLEQLERIQNQREARKRTSRE